MQLHTHATVSPETCLRVKANPRLELLHNAFADNRQATGVRRGEPQAEPKLVDHLDVARITHFSMTSSNLSSKRGWPRLMLHFTHSFTSSQLTGQRILARTSSTLA